MAIEEYGASLLADVRQRRDREAKQMRKQEERNALMGLGVGLGVKIGNEYLQNKAQNFFNQEDVLKQRIAFKNMNRQLERDIKARDAYEAQGFNYFLAEEIERIREPMQSAAGANYNPALLEEHLYAEATKNAKERERLFKERLPEIENFIANGGADPTAYSEVLKKTQPQGIGDVIRGAVSSFVGSDSNAMHLRNLRTLDTALNDYKEAYAQTKNPFASRTFAEFKEDFKDIDFGETPLSIKESKSIKVPDGMGGYRDQEALVVKQGENIVGYVDALSRQPIRENVAGDNARIKRQNMPAGVVEGTQQEFISLMDEDSPTRKTIMDHHRKLAGDDDRNTKRKDAARNDVFAGLFQTRVALQKRMSVRSDAALLLSAEMHAMNIENMNSEEKTFFGFGIGTRKTPQYNLLATRDSFSPILALAALERLERNEEGSQVGLNESTIARLRAGILQNAVDADYAESFGNLSTASKLYTLRWMQDYDTFKKPINRNGESIIDRLMSAYNIQGKI